jgi:arsenite-transporting ATPase
MNEILRDRKHVSVRLVMNPEKLVISEAMRTFTYLNLYGYLTDAVIVNRIFPSQVGDYFSGWRRVQEEHLEIVRAAFSPLPVLCAPYFDQEVVGPAMLDRLAAELFALPGHDPGAILHHEVTQTLEVSETEARLRLALPLARKGEISLKKIGPELIIRVDGHKRIIMLPPGLAGFEPRGAKFEEGTLEVTFRGSEQAGSDNGR